MWEGGSSRGDGELMLGENRTLALSKYDKKCLGVFTSCAYQVFILFA